MKTSVLFVALFVGVMPAVAAPIQRLPAGKPDPLRVVELKVAPAAVAQPALKYELLPGFLEENQGDAVPMYLKAVARESFSAKASEAFFKQYQAWLGMPAEKLPVEEVRKAILPFETVLQQLAIAARRTRCEWDPPLREVSDPFTILLPEMQDFRNLARVLAVRIHLRIAERKYDEAIHDFQTGYAMARQVAQMPFLVSALVGAAITGMMNDQLEALLQSPGAPNLYWAVTGLPAPIIDFRRGYEGEKALVYLMFPLAWAMRRGESSASCEASPQQAIDKLGELLETDFLHLVQLLEFGAAGLFGGAIPKNPFQ